MSMVEELRFLQACYSGPAAEAVGQAIAVVHKFVQPGVEWAIGDV